MPKAPQPLDQHQQELVNIVKAAHQNLAIARRTRLSEAHRRIAENRKRLEIDLERQAEADEIRIKLELEGEVAVHESALDEALIAAYESGVPIRRIALEGFGNRYDGGVHQLLRELRVDGRIGNRVGYQRNTTHELDAPTEVIFPQPIDVHAIIAESTTVAGPVFTAMAEPVVLVPANDFGEDGINAVGVMLELDSRDPWFDRIAKNARKGTPFLRATTCTLYKHPFSGELTVLESKETGDVTWDHPVARWVKEHPEEALNGFEDALFQVTTDEVEAEAAAPTDTAE